MKLTCENIEIELDESGYTRVIGSPCDEFHANYIQPELEWGKVGGYYLESIEADIDGLTALYRNTDARCELTARKFIGGGVYREVYTLKNVNDSPFFVTRESFGLQLPFHNYFKRGTDVYNTCCISHIHCGGDCMWISSVKPIGVGKRLLVELKQGQIEDYSIIYPAELPISDYRGIFSLHTADRVLEPEESMTLEFAIRFSDDGKPDCDISVECDNYTVFVGEPIELSAYSKQPIRNASIRVGGERLAFEVDSNRLTSQIAFESVGERRIDVTIDGKSTFAYVNVIPSISEILQKRARFIAEKQQYHCPGSTLDGAYLIYDRDTERTYYSGTFLDSNASRERLSMGCIVAMALREKFDQGLYDSLKKHREFVEREIFDAESGVVYNQVRRNNRQNRLYNYPWMSDYYFEWYNFSGERRCLVNAANILLCYYEALGGARQESVCMETYRILQTLEKNGELELYSRLRAAFTAHADAIIARAGQSVSEEVTCANGMISAMIEYVSQAYLLTGEEKYLDAAKRLFPIGSGFCGDQPDYHVNSTAVRFWDGYWFGKMKAYGDTMPQWLSSLSGLMLYWYSRASGADLSRRIRNNLLGGLCLYREDGFASSCYLYPYSVKAEFGNKIQRAYVPGTVFGKCYDGWANDQDWILYYANLLMNAR